MFNFEYVDADMLEKTKRAANMEYLTGSNLGFKEVPMGYMLPFKDGGGGYNYTLTNTCSTYSYPVATLSQLGKVA